MQENRYTYHFDDTIGVEEVRNLIDVLSIHEKVDLFFTTEGGEAVSSEVLIHYLNERKDDIIIHFVDYVMSSGVFILLDFKGEIKLHHTLDYILIHNIDRMLYRNREQKISIQILQKQLEEYNSIICKKLIKLGLTKQEIKDYNLGKDIILYRKDFNRLNLNKQNESNLHRKRKKTHS
jgi:hypothetical protein